MPSSKDERLRRALERLEARRRRANPQSPVITMQAGESAEEAAARARAAGHEGGLLIVPPVQTAEEWAHSASRYQAWILGRAADNEREPPSRDEIEAAYAASQGHEPMP